MNAKTHEKISQHVAQFLFEYFRKELTEPIDETLTGDAKKQAETKANRGLNKDALVASLYLGNWLTDITQFFAPDAFYEKRAQVRKLLEAYNTSIDDAFKVIEDKNNWFFTRMYKGIVVSIIDEIGKAKFSDILPIIDNTDVKNYKKKVEKAFRKYTEGNEIVKTADKIYQEAKKFIKEVKEFDPDEALLKPVRSIHAGLKISQTTLNRVHRERNLALTERNRVWHITAGIIRLKALYKFGYYSDDGIAVPDLPGGTSFELIKDIIDDMIPLEDTQSKGNFPIKLDPSRTSLFYKMDTYYPVDHLDRAFSREKLKQIPGSVKRKEDYWHDKVNKVKYDNKDGFDHYEYLDDYIKVIAGQLNEINQQMAIPYFLEKKAFDRNFYKYMARLGQTLHGVEDFFAHSNFLEHMVYNLDQTNFYLEQESSNSPKYYSKEDIFKIIQKNDDEWERYQEALKTRVRIPNTSKVNQKNASDIKYRSAYENKIVTGTFGDNDLWVSVSHIVFENLNKLASETKYVSQINDLSEILLKTKKREEITSIDSVAFLVLLIDDLLAAKKTGEQSQISEAISRRIFDLTRELSAEDIDFIFDAPLKSLGIKLSKKEKDFFAHILNLIRFIKDTITTAKDIQTGAEYIKEGFVFFEIAYWGIMCIFGAEAAVAAIAIFKAKLKKLVKEVAQEALFRLGEAFIDYCIQTIMKSLVDQLKKYFENHIFNIHEIENRGSHSILAKDEEHDNPFFFALATQSAMLIDKTVVHHLLTSNKKSTLGKKESPDFLDLLKNVFRHPLDPSRADDSPYPPLTPFDEPNFYVYVVGDQQQDLSKTVQYFYKRGLNNKADSLSIDDFREFFMRKNPLLTYEMLYDTEGTYTLAKVKNQLKDRNFKIVLPFQKNAPPEYKEQNAQPSESGLKDPGTTSAYPDNKKVYFNWAKALFRKKNIDELPSESTDILELAKKVFLHLDDTLYAEVPKTYKAKDLAVDIEIINAIAEAKLISDDQATVQIVNALSTDQRLKKEYGEFIVEYITKKLKN